MPKEPSVEKIHSTKGASSAYRWFECPGSVALCQTAPPQEDTIYSKQGTAAHWVVEEYFHAYKAGKTRNLDDFSGLAAPNGYEIGDEDIDSVRTFTEFVHALMKEGKYVLHVEAKFELSNIYPGLFGTSDIVLMESNMKRLKVIDYKHGSGIPVEVVNNKQLLYYALGAIKAVCDAHKLDYLSVVGWGGIFKEVEVFVVQPRCRHKDGAVRRWVVPAATLEAFAVELGERAKAADAPNAPRKAGDHCRFCPALGICPTFNERTFELAKADFKGVSDAVNLHLPAPEELSMAEITKILDFKDLVSEFFKRVEGHALHLLEHGQAVTGYKLVKKKANRQWKDEDAARDTLSLMVKEEDLFEKFFVSPAKAEKLGKDVKKMVQDLTFKPDTGNTIAPEHDPREAVKGTAVSDFT